MTSEIDQNRLEALHQMKMKLAQNMSKSDLESQIGIWGKIYKKSLKEDAGGRSEAAWYWNMLRAELESRNK